jgi:predicted DNA-binding transcriptional regulator YafY
MNRIERLSAILIQLQSKRVVTASEIAQRFGISTRTVYRDISALQQSGLPLGSEAGTGYFLAENYKIPPVMFTTNEAAAMLMAEKLIEKLSDTSISSHYSAAMFKVKSVLPLAHKDMVEQLNNHIEVLHGFSDKQPNNTSCNIALLQQAISQQRLIEIEYNTANSNVYSKRVIEPAGLIFYSFCWHLIAFCRLRNEYRDFRTDCIVNAQILDETFNNSHQNWLNTFYKSLTQTADLIEVKLQFDNKDLHIIERQKYYYGFTSQISGNNSTTMIFYTNSLDYIANWLLMLGNKAKITEPQNLLDLVNEKVAKLSEIYLKK